MSKIIKKLKLKKNNCQKLSFFSKKCHLHFFGKKTNFGNFLKKMSRFWQVFYFEMAIFRRVSGAEECNYEDSVWWYLKYDCQVMWIDVILVL